MNKKLFLLVAFMLSAVLTIKAQVTTSGISGIVTANSEEVIGATITATHVPSGTVYRGITNVNGRYTLTGLRAGGPYEVEVSYIGYQSKKFTDMNLVLGQNSVLDVWLDEDTQMLGEVQVFSTGGKNNMRTDRAGAVTSVNSDEMAMIPTVSRSMNDILKMTPQGGNTVGGFAVGGGNYRQSYVTVDGAAFNNAFGIGSNLPSNGSPISLDALDQITVSVSPFDVRQSGFTGGAINATTKSGTNEFKGSAYFYNTNVHLRGNKVDVFDELERERAHTTTWGATIGGPIIKNKLFFFLNGEYESNVSAGPTRYARNSDADEWGSTTTFNRPTVAQMDEMANYLQNTYNYSPGRYQGFSLDTPAYRLLARLDWNIDDNNRVNFRFSKTHSKYSNSPSASTSPLTTSRIYPGGNGRGTYYALPFESSRYYQEQNFTSLAGEWNAKWGSVNNTLRMTYSYQDEPRSVEGGTFPTVDILDGDLPDGNGSVLTTFGPDPFTPGNLRQVKTFVATDEATMTIGIHNLLAGMQFETNSATNGFMQGGNGYYVFPSWSAFVNGDKPSAYGVTTSRALDGSQFLAKMKYNQFSIYLQDQINFSDRFRLTAGLRFEIPTYPDLENNFNEPYSQLEFARGMKYSTDQLPSSKLTVSPRIGFNWDILGNQKIVLRGGTGYFVGRLPFVWLVSAVGNSNCGQLQYFYNRVADATGGQPNFAVNVADQISQLTIDPTVVTAAQSPTIIDKDLKMNAVWKSSLAVDFKLPHDINLTLEGIYSREFNPAIVTNENYIYDYDLAIAPNDTRRMFTKVNNNNHAYLITNAGNKAYYYSLTASLSKKFDFGLDLSASYTYSKSKAYSEGQGDQVTSAYNNRRFSVNGMNDMELGYGTYVAPHRLLISASYRKEYAKHFASTVGLVYEGMNMAYFKSGSYINNGTRYSYTMTSALTGDGGSSSLIYIPASREELDEWNFAAYTYRNTMGKTVEYTADMQKDDFWTYINQDDYLKEHKGEYAERGGAVAPWHHQLDFKFNQDFYLKVGKYRNTLQFGIDIKNVLNLLNSKWGVYQYATRTDLLKTTINNNVASYQYQLDGNYRHTSTYTPYNSMTSTYSIQFSLRYIFN
ncbi:MAG: TonB-dependent receptor [Prevotella sp.]|nr:TonB-dependent receptor [Prevotella sp.]